MPCLVSFFFYFSSIKSKPLHWSVHSRGVGMDFYLAIPVGYLACKLEDDLRSGLLHFTAQWNSIRTELTDRHHGHPGGTHVGYVSERWLLWLWGTSRSYRLSAIGYRLSAIGYRRAVVGSWVIVYNVIFSRLERRALAVLPLICDNIFLRH